MEPHLLIQWQTDRDLGLRWQLAETIADPGLSSLWPHYQKTASVTPPSNWSLPGAPLGGSLSTFTIPRLVEPLAYFEEGLKLYAQLSSPSPADHLVACAMRMGRARLALEMAAEGLKFSYQEAYDIHSEVMGPESSEVAKPFELVSQWMGGAGILGITNQRWVEVKAVLILISEFLARPLPGVDPKELEQFAATLLQRSANENANPGPWFEALKKQMHPASSVRSWIG